MAFVEFISGALNVHELFVAVALGSPLHWQSREPLKPLAFLIFFDVREKRQFLAQSLTRSTLLVEFTNVALLCVGEEVTPPLATPSVSA